MTLDQIKKDLLNARKDGDKDKAETLRTLVGEAENQLKGSNASKFNMLSLIKKFIKGLEDTRKHTGGLSLKQSKELSLLESYLPKVMSIEETQKAVEGVGVDQPIGKIMGQLKGKFGDRIDMKLAKQIVDDLKEE